MRGRYRAGAKVGDREEGGVVSYGQCRRSGGPFHPAPIPTPLSRFGDALFFFFFFIQVS